MDTLFDVAVIGAGVVGSAVANRLSRFETKTVLIDAASDVGAGTSKANTAILHTGFDATPSTLEAKLVHRGHILLKEYARRAGIPFEETGACLIAWNEEEQRALPFLHEKALKNGVTGLQFLSPEKVYEMEPHLGPGIRGGLLVPGESIICPYSPPIAFATEAVINGVTLRLSTEVTGVSVEEGIYRLKCENDEIRSRWVVNAAGLYSDTIDRMVGYDRFTVTPRRGELIVFDKLARRLLSHIILPIPTKVSKGVLVSPTVFGNVLVGPTAQNIDNKKDAATTDRGLCFLWEKANTLLPALSREEITATYAGLRAATESGDYQLHCDPEKHYICVGGIRSTGLSASLGIAEYLVEFFLNAGLNLVPKERYLDYQLPRRPQEFEFLISGNPDYGRLVCYCEGVSRGELWDALHAPIPARSLDGLRRRTRCLQGRCQGFFCLSKVTSLFTEVGVSTSSLLEAPSI